MIYNKYMRPFDDSLIRSVDAMIDEMFSRKFYIPTALSAHQYIMEFHTLMLNLPRQCGKTTYLQKLEAHLVKNMNNTVRITQFYSQAVETGCISLNDFYNPTKYSLPEILLFDEVKTSEVVKCVDHYMKNNPVIPKLVIALGTGI